MLAALLAAVLTCPAQAESWTVEPSTSWLHVVLAKAPRVTADIDEPDSRAAGAAR